MNILFRVDASETVGMGHLMRCLALAQSLESSNVRTHFVVNSETLALCKHRQDWVGKLYALPLFDHINGELNWLKSFCANHPIDGLVIDGYTFSEHYRENFQTLNLPVICFDDMNNSGKLFADLVINGAQEAHKLNYNETAPEAILCIGERYRVLRKEFSNSQSKPFTERTELMVTMGGSDPAMLTLPVLKALEKQDFTGSVNLVTGAANSEVASIAEYVKTSRLNITHHHDCQSMAALMKQSRLTISAAGGSQFELLACCCPSVLVVVADNQLSATCTAEQQGWCKTIDMRSFNQGSAEERTERLHAIQNLVQLAVGLWDQPDKLVKMHQHACAYANTHGAERVVENIQELLSRGN
ncbi:MAG: UDP-2,4-diacetamido-2,4,6-trideoxy-beta-L-altropyranose hydrolase [Aliiglaciecola sp.]